jgi:hypothetical protein
VALSGHSGLAPHYVRYSDYDIFVVEGNILFVPKFSFSALSTITNPYFEEYYDLESLSPNFKRDSKIVELCKLSLPNYGMLLVFEDKSVTFCINSETEKKNVGNPLVDPLVRYLIFSTYLNYNLVGGPKFSRSNLNAIPGTDRIKFKVGRLFQRTNGKGSVIKVLPAVLHLKKESVEDYLSVINWELYLAISYYLIGCQNIEYFLIEFYKSVEIIKNYFGNEKIFKSCLEPFGLDYIAYKRFKRLANDERNPLYIGRHAPKKDTMLSFIDVKNLISEPKSKQVFEESTHVCRDLISIFIHYLKAESCKK